MSRYSIYIFRALLLLPILGVLYTVVLGLPKPVIQPFTFFAFIVGMLLWILKNRFFIPQNIVLIFIFGIYNMIWILFLNHDRHIFTTIYDIIVPFTTFLLFAVIHNSNFSDKFIANSILIIKILVFITAGVSIIQVFDQDFLNIEYYFGRDKFDSGKIKTLYTYRRISIYGMVGPQSLGLGFMPLFSILIGYIMYKKQKHILLYLILGAIIAMLTNTRYIMGSYIIICLQIFVYAKSKFILSLKYIIVFFILAFTIHNLLKGFGYDITEWVEVRLFAEESLDQTTRFRAFTTFGIIFPESPIFGIGYQNDKVVAMSKSIASSSHIHVGYLSHLVNYGIVGCFFLFGFWFLIIKKLWLNAKKTGYWGSVFGFLSFFWAFSTMSQSSILYSGLIYAIIFDKFFKEELIRKQLRLSSE
jgi:hypothetical protein